MVVLAVNFGLMMAGIYIAEGAPITRALATGVVVGFVFGFLMMLWTGGVLAYMRRFRPERFEFAVAWTREHQRRDAAPRPSLRLNFRRNALYRRLRQEWEGARHREPASTFIHQHWDEIAAVENGTCGL